MERDLRFLISKIFSIKIFFAYEIFFIEEILEFYINKYLLIYEARLVLYEKAKCFLFKI